MSSTPQRIHFLFTAFPAWGHNRPFCILAARLAKENKNFVATLLLPPFFLNIAQADVAAEFGNEASEELRQRVRILSTVPADCPPDPFALAPLLAQTYEPIYQSLTQGKSISCAITGTTFDAVPAPAVVILDFFALPQIMTTRAITGHKVPIVSWVTGHPHEGSYMVHHANDDQSAYFTKPRGEIIKIRGVPDMYDWERFPQKLPFEMPPEVIKVVYGGLKACDASFFTSAYALQKEAIDALKIFLADDWKQQLYAIGPLLPSGYGEASNNTDRSAEAQDFLDKKLVENGENSVVLISFGSIFWPASPEYIEEVLEALLEKNFPFILSQASPFSVISDGLVERIKKSGVGLLSKWVPQQFVLGHPATGWFVTHAGHNGVVESLGGGVPMICWPFGADQPGAAAHLSQSLKVAFELVEVRTGEEGLKPMLRDGRSAKGTREAVGVEIREVLDACRGEKGKELRANAKSVQAELAQTWEADGISRKEFRAFLEKYGIELS